MLLCHDTNHSKFTSRATTNKRNGYLLLVLFEKFEGFRSGKFLSSLCPNMKTSYNQNLTTRIKFNFTWDMENCPNRPFFQAFSAINVQSMIVRSFIALTNEKLCWPEQCARRRDIEESRELCILWLRCPGNCANYPNPVWYLTLERRV